MLRLVPVAALCLALASACAGAPADAPAPPEPSEGQWLRPTELGYAEQQAWDSALPKGFGVIVLPAEVFAQACGGLPGHDGPCSGSVIGAADLDGNSVLLRDDTPPELLHATLLHEMGHLLRGSGRAHIDEAKGCPTPDEARAGVQGRYVMCAWNGAAQVTPEDRAFVQAGHEALGWL